ncbi:hypothetical protein [Rhizobium leguminosarum]|nr:hypothetical protein [Rhizobium leguminosarum]MBY5580874.1 hypothetical protein [Rhizobium leguminosarum]
MKDELVEQRRSSFIASLVLPSIAHCSSTHAKSSIELLHRYLDERL